MTHFKFRMSNCHVLSSSAPDLFPADITADIIANVDDKIINTGQLMSNEEILRDIMVDDDLESYVTEIDDPLPPNRPYKLQH